jgi:PIN domain nuclease of toxin-antitoxin system
VILLDTHVFIWLDIAPEKLSATAKRLIIDPNQVLYLSLVSVWEMQIKMQLNKLSLHNGLRETIQAQQAINQVQLLPIRVDHVLALDMLPFHHRDPFDRLLIAQTHIEGYTLLTNDGDIEKYDVKTVW